MRSFSTSHGPDPRLAAPQGTRPTASRTAAVDNLLLGVDVPGTEGINIWAPVHDETAAVVRLASQGVGVSPGRPFSLLPQEEGHIRVTVGLVRDGHRELAEQIAAAARTSGRTGRGGR